MSFRICSGKVSRFRSGLCAIQMLRNFTLGSVVSPSLVERFLLGASEYQMHSGLMVFVQTTWSTPTGWTLLPTKWCIRIDSITWVCTTLFVVTLFFWAQNSELHLWFAINFIWGGGKNWKKMQALRWPAVVSCSFRTTCSLALTQFGESSYQCWRVSLDSVKSAALQTCSTKTTSRLQRRLKTGWTWILRVWASFGMNTRTLNSQTAKEKCGCWRGWRRRS